MDRSFRGGLRAERTAEILIERHGIAAFDFAARQVAILHLASADASADNWRAIALEIERLQAIERARGTTH